jgi:hypothetical protein
MWQMTFSSLCQQVDAGHRHQRSLFEVVFSADALHLGVCPNPAGFYRIGGLLPARLSRKQVPSDPLADEFFK